MQTRSPTTVRMFRDEDAEPLSALLLEMAGGYGADVDPALSVPDDLVRRSRQVDILVAEAESHLLGFATCVALYPVAGLLGFTYVQQVYVARHARRRGVARDIMAAVARHAKDKGCSRVEWSTAAGNTAARALYDGLGATGTEKVHYVLDGAVLDRLAGP